MGARDAKVVGNRLTDGDRYGFLTVGSRNTLAAGNTVSSSTLQFIGICMDDEGGTQVSKNQISGYSIALCVQTSGANVHDNSVKNSCTGIFVDPGIDGAKILDNIIAGTNPGCATPDAPFFVFGIFLDGAVNSLVRHNRIEGQTASGLINGFAAAVIVFDEPTAVASGNLVTLNILRKSDLDLAILTTGTGNVFIGNRCTSVPTEPCT
jgi:hypothetical protein